MRCFQAPAAPAIERDQTRAEVIKKGPRNPILLSQPEDEPPQPRFTKARIATTEASQAQYLAERPRGLAKGQFSSASQGSFAIGKDSQLEFTPGKKMIENPTSDRTEKVTRKKMLQTFEQKDPILQCDSSYEPELARPRSTQSWRPSPIAEHSNQRQVILPAELGKSRGEFYEKRNRSSVFSDDSKDKLPGVKKRVENRLEEVPAVLQYKYALPYRETPISEKPQRMRPSESTQDIDRAFARSMTLRTDQALKRYDSEELSFDATQEQSGKLPPLGPGKLPVANLIPSDLLESRETLLSQIRNINKNQGRDLSACLRPLPIKKDSLPTPTKTAYPAQRKPKKKDRNGFKRVETLDSRPRLNYLKTARSAEGDIRYAMTSDGSKQRLGDTLRQRVLSPSQQTYAELKEELKARRTTVGERQLLKTTLDSRVSAMRTKIEGLLGKELQTLNRNGIFSPRINEVRAATLMSVKLENHVKLSVREVLQQEKDKMLEDRRSTAMPKREPKILTEEELKRQEFERRKDLLDRLEEKLVDKIARAERKAKDADDKKGIMRLTSDQIKAKLEKMKTESSKRQKPLMTLKNLPVLDIAQGSRRITSHLQ